MTNSSTSTPQSAAAKFRAMLKDDRTIVSPGVYDGLG